MVCSVVIYGVKLDQFPDPLMLPFPTFSCMFTVDPVAEMHHGCHILLRLLRYSWLSGNYVFWYMQSGNIYFALYYLKPGKTPVTS